MSEDTGKPGESGPEAAPLGEKKPPERVGPPAEDLYTAMWVTYRDGVRRKDVLKRMHKVSWRTVNQAIEYGWPEKEWPSFKARLELWNRQKGRSASAVLAEADRRAAEVAGQQQVVNWLTFQPPAAKLALQSLETLQTLGAKLQDAVKLATFVKHRRVRERNPKTNEVEVVDRPYVDGVAVAHAMRVFATAFKETGTLMSFLMGGASSRVDINLPEFTPAQLEQLRAGEVPEGLTLDQVARAYVAGLNQYAAGGDE